MAVDPQLDSFSCPICLNAFKDPVTIPCGHNYCLACIRDYWDEHECTEIYSCPECRETFTSRPLLNKNIMFAQVVEQFKKAKLRDASPQSGKTECCINPALKYQAVRLCPKCRRSYCEAHSAGINGANLREKHTVIVVSGEPKGNICLRHNMRMEIYCRTDQQLICSLCFAESHRGHDAVSVAPRDAERQVNKNCHGKTQHGNSHRSHDEGRKKHRQHIHGSRHMRSHNRRNGKRSHSKNGPETGHHEINGCTLNRHRQTNGDRHVQGRHRSSRHERSGH